MIIAAFQRRSLWVQLLAVVSAFMILVSFTGASLMVQAAVDGGVSSNIQMLDTNSNGKIDRVTIDIANGSADTWIKNGSFPHGLVVQQGGNNITITTVTILNANATTVTVQIDLDETDNDLLVDTRGATLEVDYVAQGSLGACNGEGGQPCIVDSDEEMNNFDLGDTGGTDTELDKAPPIITNMNIFSAATGFINQIILTFSEGSIDTDDSVAPVAGDFGTITLPDGSTANLAGAGFTDPDGENQTITITNITGQTTPNTAVGATAIDGITNQFKDPSNNLTVNPDDNETVTDSAKPVLLTRVTKDTDQADGSAGTTNGTLDGILATFSEIMDADSRGAGFFALRDAADTDLTEAYTDVTDDLDLFFRCTDCPPNDNQNLLKLRFSDGEGATFSDLAGNEAYTDNTFVQATNGVAPVTSGGGAAYARFKKSRTTTFQSGSGNDSSQSDSTDTGQTDEEKKAEEEAQKKIEEEKEEIKKTDEEVKKEEEALKKLEEEEKERKKKEYIVTPEDLKGKKRMVLIKELRMMSKRFRTELKAILQERKDGKLTRIGALRKIAELRKKYQVALKEYQKKIRELR